MKKLVTHPAAGPWRLFSRGSLVWIVPVLALASGGCQSQQNLPPRASVTISVAASTKEAVAEVAQQFQQKTGGEVRINAGPSNVLANQILAGAPADLFLSANRQWADKVEQANQSLESAPLLTNKLVLIVPKGNPAGVKEPWDLLKSDVKHVALAGESVPAGMYAKQALTQVELYDKLIEAGKIARGQDVRSTLAYVERGEAEAGIVYSTDAKTAKNVATVYEFDPQTHDEIVYMLVLLKHADGNAAAKSFYEFLASSNADAVWRKYGFERIPAGSENHEDAKPPRDHEKKSP